MEDRHGVGVGTASGPQVVMEDLDRRTKNSLKHHQLLEGNVSRAFTTITGVLNRVTSIR